MRGTLKMNQVQDMIMIQNEQTDEQNEGFDQRT